MNIANKIAIITGSTSGIGESIALKLCSMGVHPVICGRDKQRIDSVVQKCRSLWPECRVLGVKCDLLIESDVECLITEVNNRFGGRLDILVNNAGDFYVTDFCEDGNGGQHIAELDREMSFQRNVHRLTQLSVPLLEKNNGLIINISSIDVSDPSTIISAMTYTTIDMFTRCLAQQLIDKNINIFGIRCGSICKTKMFDRFVSDESLMKSIEESIPLRRLGKPLDIAETVAYLALTTSAQQKLLNGYIWTVSGGLNHV
ncbi:uncharacterized protein LOC128964683 [Oppia nitens]|uniref:uncharacterized protein LOC128964683 n=1 Tax=Oppia nitens TaxID=1686743 RepID=UPI0023DC9B5E|nr:uncharacterized protein LOC128964683 [Oppia nitens]